MLKANMVKPETDILYSKKKKNVFSTYSFDLNLLKEEKQRKLPIMLRINIGNKAINVKLNTVG